MTCREKGQPQAGPYLTATARNVLISDVALSAFGYGAISHPCASSLAISCGFAAPSSGESPTHRPPRANDFFGGYAAQRKMPSCAHACFTPPHLVKDLRTVVTRKSSLALLIMPMSRAYQDNTVKVMFIGIGALPFIVKPSLYVDWTFTAS